MFQHVRGDYKSNKRWLPLITFLPYRFGNWIVYEVKQPALRALLYLIYKVANLVLLLAIGGGEIPARARIGKRVKLPHGVSGIVIGEGAVLGDDVTIYHQVTIGSRGDGPRFDKGMPQIGNRVIIYAGAKIVGPVIIGDDAEVGANAVVVSDVPCNSVAVGIPAQIRSKRARDA